MPPVAEIRARGREIQQALGRLGVRAALGSARWALVQTALSRGGKSGSGAGGGGAPGRGLGGAERGAARVRAQAGAVPGPAAESPWKNRGRGRVRLTRVRQQVFQWDRRLACLPSFPRRSDCATQG